VDRRADFAHYPTTTRAGRLGGRAGSIGGRAGSIGGQT
jgi:hypothetical protein